MNQSFSYHLSLSRPVFLDLTQWLGVSSPIYLRESFQLMSTPGSHFGPEPEWTVCERATAPCHQSITWHLASLRLAFSELRHPRPFFTPALSFCNMPSSFSPLGPLTFYTLPSPIRAAVKHHFQWDSFHNRPHWFRPVTHLHHPPS